MHQDYFEIIIKYLEESTSEQENAELKKWLSKDVSHVRFFDQTKELWDGKETENPKYNSEKAYKKVRQVIASDPRRQSNIPLGRALKWVASLILISGLLFIFLDPPTQSFLAEELLWIHKETEKGKKMTLMLSDGSVVQLNGGTQISYPRWFFNSNRNVRLSGQAFFDIRRDDHSPFWVKTKNLNVAVLGTSFDVMAYEEIETSKVTVHSGIVSVQNVKDKQPNIDTLKINQQLIYSEKLRKRKLNFVNAREQTGWINGRLYFEAEKAKDIFKVLEKMYSVNFLVSSNLTDCRYTIDMKLEKLPKMLEAISVMADLDFQWTEEWINVSGNSCKQ